MKALLLIFSLQLAPAIEVVNHHPFPVRQPIAAGDAVFIADLGANGRAAVPLPQKAAAQALEFSAGGGLRYAGADLGRLAWSLVVKPAGEVDHVASFEPLELEFRAGPPQPLYTDWRAEAARSGFSAAVTARAWADGFLDLRVELKNATADQSQGMYGAVVARWEHPPATRRMLAYDNRAEEFDTAGKTRFSAGEGRHWALQHGLDWVALDFGRAAAVVMSSFDSLTTALDDVRAARGRGPRFLGASLPQIKNEARVAGAALYLIGEFARDNKPYRDRFLENRLPSPGQSIAWQQRIAFSPSMPARERADQQFVAYNTRIVAGPSRVEIGLPGVLFGTSYFPYSTLGENFGELKLPGQETDAYWPLSADTVTHWKEFADDIRRDLRIAKAMGFGVIRLHYVDVIAKLPEPLQFEYLDFLFGELRKLKLRAMFSTAFPYWSPEQIAARVARYQDTIDRLEIENEVLIWGIPLDRPQYWGRIYSAVKRAAPKVQIHWTGHLNAGIFDRLDDLRVPSDAVSAHSYIDALDAIPSGRGFALAIGNYAAKKGKPALYTEWNWRGLTRMTPEARARIYPPIFENLLATRSIHEVHQFQFQQTMCVNPHTRRGIRQYEPLWLSRRPKPEGFELMTLMERYGLGRAVLADHPVAELRGGEAAPVFHIRNRSESAVRLRVSAEASPGVEARAAKPEVTIAAGASAEIALRVTASGNPAPGFYHVFLRMESAAADGAVHYGWGEVRNPGQPEGATWNLNRPVIVVYGEDAPNIEMETAYMLAATIESASGRPVALYSAQDLPAATRTGSALILVGKQSAGADALHIPDFDAGVRFVLAFWKHAKDSAVRRVGVVKKIVPAGADVANLP